MIEATSIPLGWLWPALAGAAAGCASMGIYRLVSPQETLRKLEVESAAVQEVLRGFEGEFTEARPLLRRNLALAFRRLGLSVLSALLGGLPVALLYFWLDRALGAAVPAWWVVFLICVTAASLALKLLWKVK
jgi:hypothetical protein